MKRGNKMESKQIWTTLFISLAMSIVVFLVLTNFFIEKQVRASPGIDPTERPFPDLIISDISYIIQGDFSSSVEVTVKVKNIGNLKSDYSHTAVYFKPDNENCSKEESLALTWPLSPNEEKSYKSIFTNFEPDKCKYTIIAVADFLDEIDESNEHNNVKEIVVRP